MDFWSSEEQRHWQMNALRFYQNAELIFENARIP